MDRIYSQLVEKMLTKTKATAFSAMKTKWADLSAHIKEAIFTGDFTVTSRIFVKTSAAYIIHAFKEDCIGVACRVKFVPFNGTFILNEIGINDQTEYIEGLDRDIPYIDKYVKFNPFLMELMQIQAINATPELRVNLQKQDILYYQREETGDEELLELMVTSVKTTDFLKKVKVGKKGKFHKISRGIFGAHLGIQYMTTNHGYAGIQLNDSDFYHYEDVSQDGAIEISLELANSMFKKTGFALLGEEFSFRGAIPINGHYVYAKGHAVVRQYIKDSNGRHTNKKIGIMGSHFLCKNVTFAGIRAFVGLTWHLGRGKTATNSIDTLQSVMNGASVVCARTVRENINTLTTAKPMDLLKKYDPDAWTDLESARIEGLQPKALELLAYARVCSKLKMKYSEEKKVKEELPGSLSTYPKPYIPAIHKGLISKEGHELLTKGKVKMVVVDGHSVPIIPFVITKNTSTSFASIDAMNQWCYTYYDTMDLDDLINPVKNSDETYLISEFVDDSVYFDVPLERCISWRYPVREDGCIMLAVLNESDCKLETYGDLMPRYTRSLTPLMETPIVFVDRSKTMELNAKFALTLEKPNAFKDSMDYYDSIRPLDEGQENIGMGLFFNVHLLCRYLSLDKPSSILSFQKESVSAVGGVSPSDYLDWLKGADPVGLFFCNSLGKRLTATEVIMHLKKVSNWFFRGQLEMAKSLEDKGRSVAAIIDESASKAQFKFYQDSGYEAKNDVKQAITEFQKAIEVIEFKCRFEAALVEKKAWAITFGSFDECLLYALKDSSGADRTPTEWLRDLKDKPKMPLVSSVTGSLNRLKAEIDRHIEAYVAAHGVSKAKADKDLPVSRAHAYKYLLEQRLRSLVPTEGSPIGQMGYMNAIGCSFYDAFLEGYHSRIGQGLIWDLCVIGMTRKSNGAYVTIKSFETQKNEYGDHVSSNSFAAFKMSKALLTCLPDCVKSVTEQIVEASQDFGSVVKGQPLKVTCISIFDTSAYIAQRGSFDLQGNFKNYMIRVRNQFLA